MTEKGIRGDKPINKITKNKLHSKLKGKKKMN